MPKGKPKTDYPYLYQDEGSDSTEARHKSPQSAPHRRGGTHRVKDENATGTHWDNMDYRAIREAAREKKVYVKDMKKHEMAHALVNWEREQTRHLKEQQRKEQKQKEQVEQKKRQEEEGMKNAKKAREDKQRERAARLLVIEEPSKSLSPLSSSSEEYDPVYKVGIGGRFLTDSESSDDSETTTTTCASLSPIGLARRIRIYEWPHKGMPPIEPPYDEIAVSTEPSLGELNQDSISKDPSMKRLQYVVMNVSSTITNEVLPLPGRNSFVKEEPDFVLNLSEEAKACVRNGLLTQGLLNAKVERGSDWASRTQIQWWSGQMIFFLAPKTSEVKLQDVLAGWQAKKSVGRARRTKGPSAKRLSLKEKSAQRETEQRQKMIDVYTASEHRPTMCYVPSYLDYPIPEDVDKSLDNLFYVRFMGEQIPHYYFWANAEEWADPTVLNPAWADTFSLATHTEGSGLKVNNTSGQVNNVVDSEKAIDVRVKKEPVPHYFSSRRGPPTTSKYGSVLWTIERDLFNNGFASTLFRYREKWLSEGKAKDWYKLISRMPNAYPSGQLPPVPPVLPRPCMNSLAETFAAIEVPGPHRLWSPIRGSEQWTRDDKALWDITTKPVCASEKDIQEELRHTSELPGEQKEIMGKPDDVGIEPTQPCDFSVEVKILERRGSDIQEGLRWTSKIFPRMLFRTICQTNVSAWLELITDKDEDDKNIPSAEQIKTTPLQDDSNRDINCLAWEESFLKQAESNSAPDRHVIPLPIAELNGEDYCGATKNFPKTNNICPRCKLGWGGLNSESRSKHLRYHDLDEEMAGTKSSGLQQVPQWEALGKQTDSPPTIEQPRTEPFSLESGIFYDADVDTETSCTAVEGKNVHKAIKKRHVILELMPTNLTETVYSCPTPRREHVYHGTKRRTPVLRGSLSTHTAPATLNSEKRKARRQSTEEYKPDLTPSSHVPSPKLPSARKYLAPDHPDAKWDPNRYKASSDESLERHPGGRRLTKKRKILPSNITGGVW